MSTNKTYSEKKSASRKDEWMGLPSMRLTTRDAAIVLAVYQYRALTTPQIERLFFSDERVGGLTEQIKANTRCQHRLQLLNQHGYLMREEQLQQLSEGRRPYVYFLNERGAQVVEELLGGEELDWRPKERKASSLFLTHLLATNDVRVEVTVAARKHGFTIAKWLDDLTLKRQHMTDTVMVTGPMGARQRAAVVPDGYFLLDTGSYEYHHFLEIDLSTVTGVSTAWGRRDWARKAQAYLEYYRSGKYQERYKTQGLRILTVTTGEKRLTHLKEIVERVGGKQRFWFTTFERIRAEDALTDPIWQAASSDGYRALTW